MVSQKTSPQKNLLGNEPSPYLRQHAENPVHWRAWGAGALAEAQALNKPILLSVGYAACHWCHVMAHESFENAAIAEQMNRLFVNIKVDREERPDIDEIYMRALHALGQRGGWPLTMFLTPQAEPFWGGTYFPPTARSGMPAFPQVLEALAKFYADRPAEAKRQGTRLTEILVRPPELGEPPAELARGCAQTLVQHFDKNRGGFAGAPKFPQLTMLEHLWRVGLSKKDALCQSAVTTSLAGMAQGGIYDHLGGGLSRYAVDEDWLVPHFEKMLSDNALFLRMLGLAQRTQPRPLWRARAQETVAWLEREMSVEGAFAASLDADSEGEEGKYYVWSQGEIDAALGDEARGFCEVYGVSAQGNFEGANILHLRAPDDDAAQEKWAGARAKLLALRARRVPPARDDKILADWNGLMIEALANNASVFGEPQWLALAARAFAAVLAACWHDGRLYHSACRGVRGEARFADDLAQMSGGALALYRASGEVKYLARARSFLAGLDKEFWDDESGLYFKTPAGAQALLVRPTAWREDVTPSANATALALHEQLFLLTADGAHEARAERIADALARRATNHFPQMSGALAALSARAHYASAVLLGPAKETQSLWQAALRAARLPDIVPLWADEWANENGGGLAPTHPAFGKTAAGGKATLYLCRGRACLPPLTSPAAVADALREI